MHRFFFSSLRISTKNLSFVRWDPSLPQSHYIGKDDLEYLILLPLPPMFQDHRHAPTKMFGFVEIVLVYIKLHSLPCTVPWVLTSLVVYPSLENNTEYFCYHSISLVHHLCSQLLELMCFAYIFMPFIFTLFFVCSWLFYWMIIEETPPRYANRITFFFSSHSTMKKYLPGS